MRTKQERHRTRLLEEHRRHFERVTHLLGIQETDVNLFDGTPCAVRADYWVNNLDSICICYGANGLDLWLHFASLTPGARVFRLPDKPLAQPFGIDRDGRLTTSSSPRFIDDVLPLREHLHLAREQWEQQVPAEARQSLRAATAMAVILKPDP